MRPTVHIFTNAHVQAIAEELRRMRNDMNLTQQAAADLSLIGVKTISSYETGARTQAISFEHLCGLLRVYHVNLADFEKRWQANLSARAATLATVRKSYVYPADEWEV